MSTYRPHIETVFAKHNIAPYYRGAISRKPVDSLLTKARKVLQYSALSKSAPSQRSSRLHAFNLKIQFDTVNCA